MCLAAGAKTLYPMSLRHQIIEGRSRLRQAFRKASPAPDEIVWTSYHPLGTCKMGKDPKTSVVGLDHQAHDVPGLYVVDGSTVPRRARSEPAADDHGDGDPGGREDRGENGVEESPRRGAGDALMFTSQSAVTVVYANTSR